MQNAQRPTPTAHLAGGSRTFVSGENTGRSGEGVIGHLESSSPSEREPLLANRKHDVTVTTRSLSDDSGTSEYGESDTDSCPAPALYLNNTSPTRFLVIFSQILVIQFVGCFDSTVMASSHPAITSQFHAAPAASPLFLGCLSIFAAATAWCAAAPSIVSLIAARGLYYPYSSIIYGVGCTLGAAMGGFLAEHLGWRWIFALQIPVMLVCLCISAVAITHDLGVQDSHTSLRDSLRDFDFVGSGLLCVILITMILGLNLGGQILPWSHPIVASALVVCVACIPVFLYVEWRCASHPLVPLDFISRSPKANLLASNFISTMLTNSVLFNILPNALRPAAHGPFRRHLGGLGPDGLHHRPDPPPPVVGGRGGRLLPAGRASADPARPAHAATGGRSDSGAHVAAATDRGDIRGNNQQALATNVMVLVRSVGQMVGIAASSLLLQGSLRHYLGQLVEGEGSVRGEVIQKFLASIASISSLEPPYQMQFVESYEKALGTLFAGLAVLALVSLLILCPAKMPQIGGSHKS
ncbi:major facilitator superfamily domain-containing protein [Apiospora phragmitis]|uniref:Major facilitator superfamily domain-containing protein n=1 Tax=Apiospora phragmitis TaxID=2905665 RepID=A0ABR1TB78_9PEZI